MCVTVKNISKPAKNRNLHILERNLKHFNQSWDYWIKFDISASVFGNTDTGKLYRCRKDEFLYFSVFFKFPVPSKNLFKATMLGAFIKFLLEPVQILKSESMKQSDKEIKGP